MSGARESQVFGSKIIVNNVAVTPVFALWHITMCSGYVWQLLIIMLWFINLFQTKYGYTSAILALDSRLRTDAPALNWCVKWHHLKGYFSARFLIAGIDWHPLYMHVDLIHLSSMGFYEISFYKFTFPIMSLHIMLQIGMLYYTYSHLHMIVFVYGMSVNFIYINKKILHCIAPIQY